MTSENWDPPSFAAAFRHPELRAAWAKRVAAWVEANLEIATAWEEANGEEQRRDRIREDRYNALRRLELSGMPLRARDAYEAGLQSTPALEAVKTFLDSEKSFLLLMGSAGAGKTVATTEALAKKRGTFIRAVELARQSVFDQAGRQTLDAIHRCQLLVIDDLGAEMLHDGFKPMLDELVDVRYGARLQTIMTTNLDGQTIKARYGERVADRIRHDGLIEKCGDKSRRIQEPSGKA